jgi:uncharacterized protein (DUF1684 family)
MLPNLLMLAMLATAPTPAPAAPVDPVADVEAWRAARVARLEAPDSWLTLVGLHWVEEGTHAIGSGKDNDIVLNTGPAKLGTLVREGGEVSLALADGVDASIGDTNARNGVLAADVSGKPTLVRFGNSNFMVIERSGRLALRVRDNDAATRKAFPGRMDNYAIDPAWRIEARFEPHPPGTTIEIANIINTLEPMPNPGAVVFEKDGRTHRIEAVDEGDGQLFLIFADRTSGKETYGAGRFLYAAPAVDGRTIVDFNKAYNPPCVFTPYATCPLAPPENRLDLAVTAGEKNYAHAAH